MLGRAVGDEKMKRPLIFLFGYIGMSVDSSVASKCVYLLGRSGIVYRNNRFVEDRFFFECSLVAYKKAIDILYNYGVDVKIEERRGLPMIIYRYRRRYGIALGIMLFLFITIGSGQIVWDVRVEGNERISDEIVESALRECGFGVGSIISRVDTPVLENAVLLHSEDIAWISVNFVGNIANVSVRETLPYDETEDYDSSDIIALRDGVIQWLEEAKGNILVKEGDHVSKGDLLVSGLYPEEENLKARYTISKGKVFAATERIFDVSVPYKYEKKSYTGKKKSEIYIILFEKEIKIFGNGGNLYEKCDTINIVEYLELPNNTLLPFGVRKISHLEYETETAQRGREATMELALYTLRCRMESEPKEGTLIRKSIDGSFDDEGYKLICKAGYIENIAEIREREIGS